MESLPEEILESIVWELVPHVTTTVYEGELLTCRPALHDLMRVNRTLYRITRPALYHTMTVGPRSGEIPLLQLLKLCLNNQDLARLIKEIDFGGLFFTSPADSDEQLLPLDDSYSDVVAAIVESTDVSEHLCRSIYSAMTRGGEPGYVAALILILCDSLSVVSMQLGGGLGVVGWLIKEVVGPVRSSRYHHSRPTSTRKPLQLLHTFHLRLHYDVEDCYLLPQELECLFRLPSIRTFVSPLVHLPTPPWSPPHQSGLRYVDLWRCFRSPGNLAWVLASCPDLVTLEVELELLQVRSPHHDSLYHSLGDILRCQGTRLERFRLHNFDDDFFVGGDLGDLTRMTRLKTLDIEWAAFHGTRGEREKLSPEQLAPAYLVGLLPTSLEEFSIREAPWQFTEYADFLDPQFLQLMTSDKFPSLRAIMFRRHAPFSKDMPPCWRNCSTAVPGCTDREPHQVDMCLERIMDP